jgi:hypothetical protein
MALKARTDKAEFDSLSQDVQTHYSPDTNNPDIFCLTVTPSDGIELANVVGLKGALQKERAQVTTLKGSLSSFDGLNAEEARIAITELESLKESGNGDKTREEIRSELDASYKSKFEADKTSLTAKFTSDIGIKDQRITSLSNQLERQLIDGEAMKAITNAGGSVELLIRELRAVSKAVELENGSIVTRIFDVNGQERMSPKAGSSDPMTYAEYVSELRGNKLFAGAFKADGKSGSGATGSSGDFSSTGAVKLSGADARNPIRYRAAKERAIKQGKQLILED